MGPNSPPHSTDERGKSPRASALGPQRSTALLDSQFSVLSPRGIPRPSRAHRICIDLIFTMFTQGEEVGHHRLTSSSSCGYWLIEMPWLLEQTHHDGCLGRKWTPLMPLNRTVRPKPWDDGLPERVLILIFVFVCWVVYFHSYRLVSFHTYPTSWLRIDLAFPW